MTTSGHHSRNGFLTKRGYAELAQRTSLEGLLSRADGVMVDRYGSVSALVEVEDDFEYDENHVELNRRLIHHGS